MLQLLLGDFKGESAFAPLADLPHANGGVISNMAESAHKPTPPEDALNAGGAWAADRRSDRIQRCPRLRARRATTRPDLEPLGALVIIIDEFELAGFARRSPRCATTWAAKVGWWDHIINVVQRAEVGKMAGLIAQQTFSIGLKVDAAQSRMAIDSPRAFDDLKGAPQGTGFLGLRRATISSSAAGWSRRRSSCPKPAARSAA